MTLVHSLVGHQAAVDRVRDASAQGPDRLGLGVAGRCPPLYIGDGRRVVLELGDGYPVEDGVDLAIAASVESMAVVVAGLDGDGGGALVHGKGAAGAGALDPGHLAHELGSRQRPAADQGQQLGRQLGHQPGYLPPQLVDRDGQSGL